MLSGYGAYWSSLNAAVSYPQRDDFAKILLTAGADAEIKNNAGYIEGGLSVTPQFFAALSKASAFLRNESAKINSVINEPVEISFLQE